LPAGVATVLLVPRASEAMAALLALAMKAGRVPATEATARAVALAEGWLQSMKLAKWKVGLTLLLMAAATAGARGLLYQPPPADNPAEKQSAEQGPAAAASEKAKLDRREQARTDAYGDPLPPGALARLGTVRLRHPGGALSVAFSPDGKILASGGSDCTVRP
jgi:hypothetical protein